MNMPLKRYFLLTLTILSAISTFVSALFVFAEHNVHSMEAISNKIDIVIRGITKDGRFEEPMLDMTFIKETLIPLSVLIRQGLTLVTSSGESEIIVGQWHKSRLVDSSGDIKVFAYTLDYNKGFPKKSSLYELEALEVSADLMRILNNIVAMELEYELSGQLAVWMTHNNVTLAEIEETLGVDFSEYADEVEQILEANEPLVPPTADSWLWLLALILSALLTFMFGTLLRLRQEGGVIEQLTNWKLLATGGMAEVWSADYKGEKVVVKYPKEDVLIQHPETVRYRLGAEIRNSERLTHPNIVTFIESGEYHHPKKKRYKARYIIQELIDGYTLNKFIDPEQLLSDKVILGIVSQILDALAYMHAQNVIHRDLTWNNIMIDKKGKVYLIDLGNSTEINSMHTIIEGLRHVGTQPFHAPESIGNTPAQDFYALAMVIYAMYGGLLVTGDKTTEVRVIVGQRLDNLAPVPEWLRPVLKGCWGGEYQDSAKLREALRLPSMKLAITQVGEQMKNSPPNS
jgi:tRNA A-37 threonylcarbamoyl transferase component Bud32